MSTNILTEYSDRVRYFLSSRTFGTIQIQDPIGWDEDEKEFTRNKDEHGVFTTLSNSLRFTKKAKEFIELVYATEGINADLLLIKESKDSVTDYWEKVYEGYLDLSTREIDNNQLAVKFNTGGLQSILKNREGEEVEIDRSNTLSGSFISKLQIVDLHLKGRRIFLESTWRAAPMNYYKRLYIESKDGNTRNVTNTLPFDIFKKSQEQANSTYDGLDGNENAGEVTMMLLFNVDRKRTFTVDTINISFNCYGLHNSSVDWGHVNLHLVKYKNGSNLQRDPSVYPLWKFEFNGKAELPNGHINVPNSNYTITLDQGESLGIEMLLKADFDWSVGSLGATYRRDFFYKLNTGNIIITEDSEFQPTICKAVKPFDLATRIVHILTGRKDAVKSDILKSGKWKNLLVTHGFWIRGFSRELDLSLPEDSRKFKPLTTSFKDFITSLAAVCNIGVGIEKIGAREYVVIEDLKYFYNRNTTIKLPFQVKNVKRSTDASLFYKSIELGYEKGGEYEEAMGLDEYNVRNSYTTCIHRVDNKYTKLSKYRADTYGIEFARRKPFAEYSTEDTNYDQDIFFIDCKDEPVKTLVDGVMVDLYQTRLYNDDFNALPKGVFSPETAFNLRLSPVNTLLRHGWYISNGLIKYPVEKIRYISSKGNSNLITTYPETAEIENSKLDRPRFEPEIVEFNHICTVDILRVIEAQSNILGQKIRNPYGLVEFTNEEGSLEKGFLLSLKPNGSGVWKILKYTK